MHHAIKPLLAASLLAAAGLAAANDDPLQDARWLTDDIWAQGSFAAAVQSADALSSAWSAHDGQVPAGERPAPMPAYALTLAGLAMMGALVRRRRRDTF